MSKMKNDVATSMSASGPQPTMKIKPESRKRHHRIALAIVTTLAFLTRFCGLGHPSEVVFDEAHIMRFASWYITRSYFFDIHPPFGRLLYASLGWLLGYDGHFIPYDVGGSYIKEDVPYLALRSMPALLSTLTVSLVYLIMWESGYALPACMVASGLIVLDNAHISQCRLIYLDAILVFTLACSLLCYIKFSKLKKQAFSKQWWTWLFLTGIALSCNISTKYVGLFAFITIGTAVLFDLWELFNIRSKRTVSILDFMKHVTARLVTLIVIPFMLYLFWFWVNFAVLIYSGTGDNYMSDEFQETLIGNIISGKDVKIMSFFQKWFELQGLMFYYNSLPDDPHPYQSRPWQWPLGLGGVSFWESDATRQQIYFVGNIAGWWITSILVVVFVLVVVIDGLSFGRGVDLIRKRERSRLHKSGGFFFLAWATHYVPFFFMSRQLMLHTYLPGHLASCLVTGSLVEFFFDSTSTESKATIQAESEKTAVTMDKRSDEAPSHLDLLYHPGGFAGSSTVSWLACSVVLCVTFAFWWFWLPLTYGYPGLSIEEVQRHQVIGYRLHHAYDYSQYKYVD